MLRPPQNIFDIDGAHLGDLVEIGTEIGQTRQPRQLEAQRLGALDHPLHCLAGDIVMGDDQPLRPLAVARQPLDDLVQGIDCAQNMDAMNIASHTARLLADNADDLIGGARVTGERPDKHLGRIAGADQHDRDAAGRQRVDQPSRAPVLELAVQKTGAAK